LETSKYELNIIDYNPGHTFQHFSERFLRGVAILYAYTLTHTHMHVHV
jgi:hypothetical protein